MPQVPQAQTANVPDVRFETDDVPSSNLSKLDYFIIIISSLLTVVGTYVTLASLDICANRNNQFSRFAVYQGGEDWEKNTEDFKKFLRKKAIKKFLCLKGYDQAPAMLLCLFMAIIALIFTLLTLQGNLTMFIASFFAFAIFIGLILMNCGRAVKNQGMAGTNLYWIIPSSLIDKCCII
eukprot:411895_1